MREADKKDVYPVLRSAPKFKDVNRGIQSLREKDKAL